MRKLLVLLTVIVLAGCGVTSDRKPRDIDPSNVQYNLLDPSTTTTSTAAPASTASATVFLLGNNNRLVAVQRQVTDTLTVGSALASLIQGSTVAEQAQGLRSAINQQTAVLGAEVTSGIAMVDVSDAFSGVDSQEQILALAQVVYTATEITGVSSVQILLNSSVVEVPKSDGTLTREPLIRNDYSSVGPA